MKVERIWDGILHLELRTWRWMRFPPTDDPNNQRTRRRQTPMAGADLQLFEISFINEKELMIATKHF